jgi:hypothetical protein
MLLPGRATGRREKKDGRAVAPEVADLAAGLAVSPNVLVTEEVVRFAHG